MDSISRQLLASSKPPPSWIHVGALPQQSGSSTVSFPATTQAGDVVWMYVSSNGTVPAVSGWTTAYGGGSIAILYRICGSGESSMSLGFTPNAVRVFQHRPVNGSAAFTGVQFAYGSVPAPSVSQTLTSVPSIGGYVMDSFTQGVAPSVSRPLNATDVYVSPYDPNYTTIYGWWTAESGSTSGAFTVTVTFGSDWARLFLVTFHIV